MPHIIHDQPLGTDPDTARQQAIRQLERKRRFRISAIWSAVGMLILVAIWAMSEYHNAGGWPTQGFSQSSGIHDVWNFWIIYPLGVWLMILAAHAWSVYGNKPPSTRSGTRSSVRTANGTDQPRRLTSAPARPAGARSRRD